TVFLRRIPNAVCPSSSESALKIVHEGGIEKTSAKPADRQLIRGCELVRAERTRNFDARRGSRQRPGLTQGRAAQKQQRDACNHLNEAKPFHVTSRRFETARTMVGYTNKYYSSQVRLVKNEPRSGPWTRWINKKGRAGFRPALSGQLLGQETTE